MKLSSIILQIFFVLVTCLLGNNGYLLAQEVQTIRVGIRPYAPPIIYFDKSDDGIIYKGSEAEVLSLLENNLNARFEYISSDDVTQRRQWLMEGRIDVIADTGQPISQDPMIRFIPTGIKLEYRIFANKDCQTEDCYYDFSNKQFVLISGVVYPKFIQEIEQNQKIVVNTDEEALRMLEEELVDLFVTPSQKVAQYIIAKEGLKNVHAVGEVLGRVELGYAVRADNEELFIQFETAITELRNSGTIAYLDRKHYQEAFEEIRRSKNTVRLRVMISIFVMIIIVGSVWSYLLRSRVRYITKELKMSEDRLTNLIKFSPEMIFVVTSDGSILQHNQSADIKFGEMLKQTNHPLLFDFVIPEEREFFNTFLKWALEGKKCINEFHFKDAKDNILDVEVVAMLLPTTDPKKPTICCYARDMTNRKRLEHELIQADRLATIGQMAAAVAHEINNPLGIVQANVDLLISQGIEDAQLREVVQVISRNVDRAGKITHNLLDVAKPKPPEMKIVNPVVLVQHTLDFVKLQLKGIDIQHDMDQPTLNISGDPGLLEQVFINLLLNSKTAMQHSKEKRLTIQHGIDKQNHMVSIHISDTGKGISSEKLEKVFDPFYTTNKRSGFGLGLFLSHRIIEHHGGILSASSEEGEGSTFSIELPAI